MVYKFFTSATACALLAAVSFNANAAIIDKGTYTTDTVNGLDWLDLTETRSMSYNDVTAQLGAGGSLEGWRYATEAEIVGFFDAFGGDSDYYYAGWNTQNNGLFDIIAPLWGYGHCAPVGCTSGEGFSNFMHDGAFSTSTRTTVGTVADPPTSMFAITHDFVSIAWGATDNIYKEEAIGSALVRDVSTVPVPAAVWLFGSALIGLIGFARRKKA